MVKLYPMKMSLRGLQAAAVALALCGSVAIAQEQSTPSSANADNSAQNKNHQTTAQQQPENTSDRMLTKKVRQALIADKSLNLRTQRQDHCTEWQRDFERPGEF